MLMPQDGQNFTFKISWFTEHDISAKYLKSKEITPGAGENSSFDSDLRLD
jgi:hypothetical protein